MLHVLEIYGILTNSKSFENNCKFKVYECGYKTFDVNWYDVIVLLFQEWSCSFKPKVALSTSVPSAIDE